MKAQPDQNSRQQPEKLKTPSRPFFSCSFFRHCTQSSSLSPTGPLSPPPQTPHPPSPHPHSSAPPPPPPPPPPQHNPIPRGRPESSESSSSSASTSQSFTVWRFPSAFHHSVNTTLPPPQLSKPESPAPSLTTNSPAHSQPETPMPPTATPPPNLQELFHVAELEFVSGSDTDRFAALHMLERSLVPNPPTGSNSSSYTGAPGDGGDAVVPSKVMDGVVGYMKRTAWARSATKVLLALCLAESNRRVAVARGAAGCVVEALSDLEGAAAERALAALDLMCTVAEGAAEVRGHALAVLMLVAVMGKMGGRGREHAISVLAVVFGSSGSDGDEAAVLGRRRRQRIRWRGRWCWPCKRVAAARGGRGKEPSC